LSASPHFSPPFLFCVSSEKDIHDTPANWSCRLSRALLQLKIDGINDVSDSDLFDIVFSGMLVAGE
jgi:hypothetical protein